MKKSDLILLLLNADNEYPINGITRFEKLVFLTQKEIPNKSNIETIEFDFQSDRFGPLSMEIYDELDFLKSVGMIEEIEERKYKIKDKGVRFLGKKTFGRVSENMQNHILDIKKTHGRKELKDILKYVYINYPDFTTKSEILGKVLG